MGKEQHTCKKVIALAGNPNVGKSTIFNGLTGLKQHTGNWAGKTVANAVGYFQTAAKEYELADIPGMYSLMAHSAEEEVARNYICFGNPDAVVVVCDATCLERNLNLVLQIIEVTPKVLVCLNLMDEAGKKGIHIDTEALSDRLKVPVADITARDPKSLCRLTAKIDELVSAEHHVHPRSVTYSEPMEQAITMVAQAVLQQYPNLINSRWISLKLLEGDEVLLAEIEKHIGEQLIANEEIREAWNAAEKLLKEQAINKEVWQHETVSALVTLAEEICRETVSFKIKGYHKRDRKIDEILTSRKFGYPLMGALLIAVLWLTITGANYPSQLLSMGLSWLQDQLTLLFALLHAPEWLHSMLVLGVYRVTVWVVSVMLPPMAIFFPLFTLLEDSGYLPRIAYNLDKPFKCCGACGKQSITMCMGLGCNAVGVTGCRIIDSPRERLIAILTNNFVPCNGRLPVLIALISMFFAGIGTGSSAVGACLLAACIFLGIMMTFAVSKLLSKTLLRGVPSSFTLELPPYRLPQFGKVLVRSLFDRTLFVLGRAVSAAAPAGLVIWLLANIHLGDVSMLNHLTAALDPFGRLLGMDGIILMAFILGMPANEIVLPIMLMIYMGQAGITDTAGLTEIRQVLISNGWSIGTAVCVILFTMMHWPCTKTLLTIRKETGSIRWMAAAFAIPAGCGVVICFLMNQLIQYVSYL